MKQGKTSFLKETQKSVDQQIIDTVEGEEKFCELVGITKKQVDFKAIIETFDTIQLLSESEECFNGSKNDINNLQLFFKLLAKSSTFAHKAHKELKQLNI